jgi:hypothetical protein
MTAIVYDGTYFHLAWSSRPTRMAAPLTLYVNDSTGSDNNFGLTAGSPFKTIQKALATSSLLNLGNQPVSIVVADGAYTGPLTIGPYDGFGSLTITGNVATPSTVIITSNNASCVHVFCGDRVPVRIDGFKLVTTGAATGLDPADLVWVHNGSVVTLAHMNYGASVASHIGVDGPSMVVLESSQVISGNVPGAHLFAVHGGARIMSSPLSPPSLNIPAPVTLGYFAMAAVCGDVEVTYGGGISNPGNVTATRYSATMNGTIVTAGGGASYYPGTVAGSVSNGGQYV